jgi:hypothetical protein
VGGKWVGKRRTAIALPPRRLVVVRDFDIVGISILPPETDPILVVDPNTVLTRAVAT